MKYDQYKIARNEKMRKLLMKYRPIVLPILSAVLLTGNVRAQTVSSSKPTCAILPFDARAGIAVLEAESLGDRFAVEFDRLGRYRIVPREKMREVLEEQRFQATESCSAAACAAEAGRILGVRYMVYGTVPRLGELFSVNSFMLDVETGEQVRSATTDMRGGIEVFLTEGMRDNATELLGVFSRSSDLKGQQTGTTSDGRMPTFVASDQSGNRLEPEKSGSIFFGRHGAGNTCRHNAPRKNHKTNSVRLLYGGNFLALFRLRRNAYGFAGKPFRRRPRGHPALWHNAGPVCL